MSKQESLEQGLAQVASAIADGSRARMLCALMDGRAWTATELSLMAEVSASTASSHLARLQQQGLTACVRQGKHRYYRPHRAIRPPTRCRRAVRQLHRQAPAHRRVRAPYRRVPGTPACPRRVCAPRVRHRESCRQAQLSRLECPETIHSSISQ